MVVTEVNIMEGELLCYGGGSSNEGEWSCYGRCH